MYGSCDQKYYAEYSIGHKSEVRWYANIRIPKVNIGVPRTTHNTFANLLLLIKSTLAVAQKISELNTSVWGSIVSVSY